MLRWLDKKIKQKETDPVNSNGEKFARWGFWLPAETTTHGNLRKIQGEREPEKGSVCDGVTKMNHPPVTPPV